MISSRWISQQKAKLRTWQPVASASIAAKAALEKEVAEAEAQLATELAAQQQAKILAANNADTGIDR